jgi:DNA-binding MarR family transcriptional regulator
MRIENVANLLGALAALLSDEVADAVARDRSSVESTALSLLVKNPGASVEELRGPLELSHSGCVRLVDRLESLGYVERRSGKDARAVALVLTRKGRESAAASTARRQEVLVGALAALSPGEQQTLGALVTKVLDRAVVVPRTAMRTCRLCDYDASEHCPMHKFADAEP